MARFDKKTEVTRGIYGLTVPLEKQREVDMMMSQSYFTIRDVDRILKLMKKHKVPRDSLRFEFFRRFDLSGNPSTLYAIGTVSETEARKKHG